MRIFEYPYVIITILVLGFLIMGAIGLYYTVKCVKAANGTEEKGFSGIGRTENRFNKLTGLRKNRCIIYISISLDSVKRIYPESKSLMLLSQIRTVLLKVFTINENDSISMYGNNSFVAVNEYTSDLAVKYIEECFNRINKILISNEAVNVAHVNFGFYCTNSTEITFKTALGRAKQSCTMANDKKILFCEWNNNNGKEFDRKIKIENNIHNELENNRFFLEYQPFLDVETNKIVGAEVLSRLNSERDGILTPQSFLSAVNNVGLTEKFDFYIFEKNCKWIANNKKQREKYVYTINFSRSTLCDDSFALNISSIIEKYGLKYSSLAIEILEDKNLTDDERCSMTQNLSLLKEKGVLILLDDFGRGYTSFSDLSSFDISIVKIDKTITQNAVSNTGFLILKNIVKTAKDLGFKTLCEGVENEEQFNVVKKAGCDIVQGYYFYRPMPVAKLELLLEENS